ncbi:MAG: hypothetical protein IKK58_06080 [Clostridia bacterium]|nr:hypothetical protein [Clostridia bacterium]
MTKKSKNRQKSTKSAVMEKMKGGKGDIKSDVLGSYTGNPEDGGMPQQDADDL